MKQIENLSLQKVCKTLPKHHPWEQFEIFPRLRFELPNNQYIDVDSNGAKLWYQNGKRHRTDGPAIEGANGDKLWCQNGKLHRTDGPAFEYADGDKLWYLDGKKLSEEEFLRHH